MAHTQSNPSRAEQTAGGCRMPEHGISRGASDSLLLHTPLSQLLKYLPNSSSQHTTRRKDTKSPTFIEVQLKEEVPYTKLEIKSRYVFFFPGREIASSALSVRRSVRACYSLHLLYVEKKSCYGHSNKAVSALTWFSSKLIFWASPSNKAKWLWKPRTHIFIRMYTIDKERDCKRLLHHLIKQGLTNCIPTNSI